MTLTGVGTDRAPSAGLPVRTRVALAAGRGAGALSRLTGRGAGTSVAGRVVLRAAPGAVRQLAAGRWVAVVSGTNGKTTTTRMLATAFGTVGEVASNGGGSNLAGGVVVALSDASRSPSARLVLEVDELTLSRLAVDLGPALFVLLNLSRDQLDRAGEMQLLVAGWCAAVRAVAPGVAVVNADDQLCSYVGEVAAEAGHRVVWVAGGHPFQDDAGVCARCGATVRVVADEWECSGCGRHRPTPDWTMDGDRAIGPGGADIELALSLPGRANRSNATMVLAAATAFGIPTGPVVHGIRGLSSVGGRYLRMQVRGSEARLLVAKNPGSWLEVLDQVQEDSLGVVIVVNARAADGRDPSWLYDVPYERLRGRRVVVSGDRAADMSVRLRYGEVDHTTVPDPLDAVASLAGAPCHVVASYTAFTDLRRRLGIS